MCVGVLGGSIVVHVDDGRVAHFLALSVVLVSSLVQQDPVGSCQGPS